MRNYQKTLQSTQKPESGFTLIELLIGLTVISILAALLFPVFARAREKARQTTCLSSERQLGLAFAQYTQDYGERNPSGTIGNLGRGWAGQAFPYVKSADLYKCPDDATRAYEGDLRVLISYAMNSNSAGSSLAEF